MNARSLICANIFGKRRTIMNRSVLDLRSREVTERL